MRFSTLAFAAAAALAAPATAAPVQEFRLPTPQSEQPRSTRQGPVAPDVPESRDVRNAETPAPTPPPVTQPEPAPLPAIVVPTVPTTSTVSTAQPAPTQRPAAGGPSSASATSRPPAATASGIADPPAPVAATSGSANAPVATPAPVPAPSIQQGGASWVWPAAAAALAALGAVAAFLLKRRRGARGPATAPVVERPQVPSAPAPERTEPKPDPAPAPRAPEPAPNEPLQLALEPLRLSLTLLNASLAYRLEVANNGPTVLAGLKIEADMISAHASLGREEQLAGPGSGAPARHTIERLAPGETRVVDGEFRLPFPQIVPIRQGDAALLLPLARFRASAEGAAPVVKTFAVGQAGAKPGAGLQPFRLDQGPRIYPELAQRAFA